MAGLGHGRYVEVIRRGSSITLARSVGPMMDTGQGRTWNGDALHIRTQMDLTSHHLGRVLVVRPQIMPVWLLPSLVEVLCNAWRYKYKEAEMMYSTPW
jgi:hypothetical protein